MNILIVASDFKPLTGGIAEYTHYLGEFLSRYGHKVFVYAPNMEQDSKFDRGCSYKIIRYDFAELRKLTKISRYQKEYKTFKSLFLAIILIW